MAKTRSVQRITSGSPGAVLALAIGTAFLSLGWTGRYRAVWEAFRTGKSENDSGPQNPVTDNNKTVLGMVDPVNVTTVPGDFPKVVEATDIEGTNPGDTCHPQYQKVKTSDGKLWCVAADKLFDPLPIDGLKQNNRLSGDLSRLGQQIGSAGQVIEPNSDLSTTILPNGAFAFTKQPNVKGMFDVG